MCDEDSDCTGALVCYTNLTWTEFPFCDCSHFYGGAGENCEELSTQSFITLALAGTGLLILLATTLGTLCVDVRVAFIKHGLYKSFDNTTITWAYAFLAEVCMLVWSGLVIYSAVAPETNDHFPVGSEDKNSRLVTGERASAALSIFFAITACLNISLVWLDVASSTNSFKQSNSKFKTYKILIRAVQLVWFLVVVIQAAVGITVYVTAIGACLSLGIAITYFFGRIRFVKVLENSATPTKSDGTSPEDKRLRKVLNMIRTTSSGTIVLCTLIFLVAVALVPFAIDWKEYGRPGGASVYATMLNTLLLIFAVVLAFILYYTHRMLFIQVEKFRSAELLTDNNKLTSYGKEQESYSV